MRIEAITEEVARAASRRRLRQAFADASKRAPNAVGLKTIVAYRCTFEIDQTAPRKAEVIAAVGDWIAGRRKRTFPAETAYRRHGLWIGAEICRARKLPLQVHVGFGDPDIYMHACDPTHFTDFIAAMEKWEVPITLLHN